MVHFHILLIFYKMNSAICLFAADRESLLCLTEYDYATCPYGKLVSQFLTGQAGQFSYHLKAHTLH